jgi:hypothetical protein
MPSDAVYQVMPALTASEIDELRESIRKHGIKVPIVVSPDGEIVDGHHRAQIAAELRVMCPQQIEIGTPAELRSLAYSLNLDRRQLSREQKRELVEQSLRADPQLSNREHARRTGVADTTVAPIRDELEGRAVIPHVAERTDSVGRQQPARKPTPEGEAFLDNHLASDPDIALLADRKRVQQALAKAWSFTQYEPDFAGRVLDDDHLIDLDNLITNLTGFRDAIRAARTKPLAEVRSIR